jgi:mannan endo-1,4-beta-mannosidase
VKKTSVFILILVMTISGYYPCEAQTSKNPVNKNTTPEAKALLKYLYSLQGKNILSGQHNYGSEFMRSSDSIKAYTGKYPAIWGCDFASVDRRKLVEEAVLQYKNGSIVTLMYHMKRPFDADTVRASSWKKLTDAEWNELLTPGTRIHQLWQDNMDTVAFYMKELQKANVPVLWRPYHEMNGVWFWWGNKRGENGFKKLWIMTYDRFVNYHKLNNLIWVWNTNAPRDWENDQAYAYDLFYPGDEYVDVLTADIYKNDFKQSHHDQLLALGKGKLIALGEVGTVPIPEILDTQLQWSWFMVWAQFPWIGDNPQLIRKLYQDPRVITKDEIKK